LIGKRASDRRPALSQRARIVSLVPNATEILFALGAGDRIVGVSHECDFPSAARALPQLTCSALAADLGAAAIDAAVSAQLASGPSLYRLDDALLAELAPDLLFTQDLCPVCAVSRDQVARAVHPLPRCPEVVALDPHTLADVFADIARVGALLSLTSAADCLRRDLELRLDAVAHAVAGRARPRVVALEWLDPLFAGGHWVPEMIAAAGGLDCIASPGDPSRRLEWSALAALDPDVLVAMPCGFDAAGSRAQVAALAERAEWQELRAVREGRVIAVDANGCFSRPGPRLIDGVEALAAGLHPSCFADAGLSYDRA